MAPELCRGGDASAASDVYAIGILLYHLLTGKYPVDEGTLKEAARVHETGHRRSIYDDRPDLPEKLVQVIETATRANPGERYQSAGQMLSALSESVAAGSVQTLSTEAAPRKRGLLRWWMAFPALAFLLLFTPVRQILPFLRTTTLPAGTGTHATFLKAQDQLDKYYLPHNVDHAIEGFQETVKLDPQFALAFGGLCRAYFINYRDHATPELLTNTQDACSKALDLDHDRDDQPAGDVSRSSLPDCQPGNRVSCRSRSVSSSMLRTPRIGDFVRG